MNGIISIMMIGLISGVAGTAVGGCLALFSGKIKKRTLSSVLEFSAGLMMSVVCFDLLPQAFTLSNFFIVMAGLASGVLFAMLVQDFIKYGKKQDITLKSDKSRMLSTGVLMFIGIAAHNFPEGLAVGSGFEASASLGISLALVILIHDIPEGMAMAIPLRSGGFSALKAIMFAAISGIPNGIGALVGALIGGISKDVISLCMSLAAGAMLYISIGDLVPESKRLYSGRLPSFLFIIGTICGIILCFGLS